MTGRHLVPDGLSVRGDQVSLHTGPPQCERRGVGEGLADQHVHLADLVDTALLGAEQRVDPLAELVGDG